MPEGQSFNWWEALGTGVGGTLGGIGGFLVGGPAGAIAGAGLGANIGQQISPGGFWNPNAVQPEALPQTASAGVTAAALREMEAASSIIRRDVGTGVQAIRNRFGQAGTFQSGARGRAEDVFRQQGIGRLSDALAGIELEAIRARQSGQVNTIALQMQEAQFAWQKRQMENQMLTDIVSTGLQFILPKASAPTPSLNPLDAFNDAGIDPMVAMSGGSFQPANPAQTARALELFGGQ